MDKIYVVYWSQTGNTEEMAEAVAKGIESAGKAAALVKVGDASLDEIKSAGAFALGCPAMGDEVLEEVEFEPFVQDIEGSLKGKKVALFGAYGWGDGQWMRDWQERMENAGADIVDGEGLICQEAPDGDMQAQCEALGKKLAQA